MTVGHLRSPVTLGLVTLLIGSAPNPEAGPIVAVLSIEFNNIHKSAPDSLLAGRIARLGDALRTRLAQVCGYEVTGVDASLEAAAHLTDGYFYDHPEVAADLARQAGADWAVIPRLNRTSAWVADIQAHVVRVRDTLLVSNRIVELKGLELTPELAARLTNRGSAWMADQLSQAIELVRNPSPGRTRRCPP